MCTAVVSLDARGVLLATALMFAAACATGAPHQGDDVPDVPDAGLGQPDATPDLPDASSPDSSVVEPKSRIVILMIGDGMGPVHVQAASQYAHGAANSLRLQALPVHGEMITASLSGVTDSAAAATAMATGAKTFNGNIGIDRSGSVTPNLVEVAHDSGLSAGVVTTAALPHATPAGFTAHRPSRHGYVEIANDQALLTQPEVMLGGGMQYYAPAGEGSEREDGGLIDPLLAAGYQVVTTSAELAAASPEAGRIVGLFAAEHLDYTVDRAADCTQPTLAEMSLSAIEFLSRDDDGFLLVIEGARIDMASHGNDLERALTETVAFDQAVAAVADWAEERDDVTLLVTADHETGGLQITTSGSAGVLPDVSWQRADHTNARVDLYCAGTGCEPFDGAARDFTWLHAAILARITDDRFAEPAVVLTPDGHLDDMRYKPVEQTVASGFGAGFNQLDAMYLDADRHGLAVGVEGLFERGHNAVVLLVDADFDAGTGFGGMAGALADASGRADAILTGLNLGAPDSAPGFGADFALVAWGGTNPRLEDLNDDTGLRGLVAPVGDPNNLWWYSAATNFGEDVRAGDQALTSTVGEGFEAFIPWTSLFPGSTAGQVPSGARVAVTAILVNDDGGYSSNQALPPFATGADNPGRDVVPLPGVVELVIDSDDDGVADGNQAPTVW